MDAESVAVSPEESDTSTVQLMVSVGLPMEVSNTRVAPVPMVVPVVVFVHV